MTQSNRIHTHTDQLALKTLRTLLVRNLRLEALLNMSRTNYNKIISKIDNRVSQGDHMAAAVGDIKCSMLERRMNLCTKKSMYS